MAVSGSVAYVADEIYFDVLTLECRAPEADFGWESWALAVEFTDHSLYGPVSWSWDFGDGSTSSERDPSHTYSAPGLYRVVLTVGNDHGSDEVTRFLRVGVPDDINRSGTVQEWETAGPQRDIHPPD